jgi:hypothetical protein
MLLHDVDSTKGATSQNDALYHNNSVSVHRHCTGHLLQVLVKVHLFNVILNPYTRKKPVEGDLRGGAGEDEPGLDLLTAGEDEAVHRPLRPSRDPIHLRIRTGWFLQHAPPPKSSRTQRTLVFLKLFLSRRLNADV